MMTSWAPSEGLSLDFASEIKFLKQGTWPLINSVWSLADVSLHRWAVDFPPQSTCVSRLTDSSTQADRWARGLMEVRIWLYLRTVLLLQLARLVLRYCMFLMKKH